MMELFTLGADRGAYTERDVREQARVADRVDEPLEPRLGDYNFHSTHPPRRRHEDRVPQGGHYDWQDACKLCLYTRCTRRFPRKLLGLLRAGRARPRDRAPSRPPPRSTATVKPVLNRLKHPVLYAGPRMVKPPVVHPRPAAPHRRGRYDRPWAWIGASPASSSLPAERRGLGRHPLARHRDVPGPLDRASSEILQDRSSTRQGEGADRRRRRCSGRRSRSEQPGARRRDAPPLLRFTQRALQTRARTSGSRSSIRCWSRTLSAS